MEVNKERDKEILEQLNEKIWILKTNLEILSATGKEKYAESLKKTKREIEDMIFDFMYYGMKREFMSVDGKMIPGDMELYTKFLNDLMHEYCVQYSKVIKKIPLIEREKVLKSIREEMLEKERNFCNKLYIAHAQFPTESSEMALKSYEQSYDESA